MLDLAAKHACDLRLKFIDITFDERFMFYNMNDYRDEYTSKDSTWNRHEFVSLDSEGNIIGFIGYDIHRVDRRADSLCVVNFTLKPNLIFSKDLAQVIDDIFCKFNFRTLTYCVIVDNPACKIWDKFTDHYGGRIVGDYKKIHCLLDGRFYDKRVYQLLRDDYIKHRPKIFEKQRKVVMINE